MMIWCCQHADQKEAIQDEIQMKEAKNKIIPELSTWKRNKNIDSGKPYPLKLEEKNEGILCVGKVEKKPWQGITAEDLKSFFPIGWGLPKELTDVLNEQTVILKKNMPTLSNNHGTSLIESFRTKFDERYLGEIEDCGDDDRDLIGQLKEGVEVVPHGIGHLYNPSAGYYFGQFSKGIFHGHGLLVVLPSCDFFIGKFNDGMKTEGKLCRFSLGWQYIGSYDNNTPHGKGFIVYKDGRKYVGDFEEGVKHGSGKFRWANGDEFEGPFVNDKIHGSGSFTSKQKGMTYTTLWERGELLN